MTVARRDKIRVVIAEDQAMVLGALAALLEMEADIEVVARARDGEEALRVVGEFRPDVFITDIEMPKQTGLEVAAEPGAGAGARSGAARGRNQRRAPRSGAAV